MRTLNRAKTILASVGLITMLGGTYPAERLDASGAGTQLTIEAAAGENVDVIFGQTVNEFTLHSGTVWKAEIDEPNGNTKFVFQWGEAQTRRPHYAMTKAASIADVATSKGRWFYSEGWLYIRPVNTIDPNGFSFHVPSNSATDSFLYNGSGGSVVVNRINSLFAYHGFDFSGLNRGEALSCMGYGSTDEGCTASDFLKGGDTNCEWACSGNDGVGLNGRVTGPRPLWTTRNAWINDCFDKGASGHYRMTHQMFGGTYEYNASGATPYGGCNAIMDSVTTRGNLIGIDNFAAGEIQEITASNWLSEDDTDAFAQWAEGEIYPATIEGSRIIRANRGLITVNPLSFINSNGTIFTNCGTNVAGYTDNITLT